MPSAPTSLTQLSSVKGEIPIQNDPLLNALRVGARPLVDGVDSLLDGGVDRFVLAARDLRDSCGVAAQLPAELDGFRRQFVLWVSRLHV